MFSAARYANAAVEFDGREGGGARAGSGIACGFACRSYIKALSTGTEHPARNKSVVRCDAVDGGGIAHGQAFEPNARACTAQPNNNRNLSGKLVTIFCGTLHLVISMGFIPPKCLTAERVNQCDISCQWSLLVFTNFLVRIL